jgi:hypothetical protein
MQGSDAGGIGTGVTSPLAPTPYGPLSGTPNDAVVFDFTGGAQTFTVPPGVVSVGVRAWGAEGGQGKEWCNDPCPHSSGGLGAYVSGTIAVAPGQRLTINVGGAGGGGGSNPRGAPGWNGGGQGGIAGGFNTAGGGGGASSLLVGDQVLLVAGGGGGGGGGGTSPPPGVGGFGGAGGNPAVAGHPGAYGSSSGGGGQPGTTGAGGAGGAGGSGTYPGAAGSPGATMQGGAGANGTPFGSGYRTGGGGGGGGGWFGGGGGGAGGESGFFGGGGGGGGASWAAASVQEVTYTSGLRAGNGRVELTPAAEQPRVDLVGDWVSNPPALPDGLKVACLRTPDRTDSCDAYPVLRYRGLTYWPLSYLDNRLALSIVAYDAAGSQVARWDRDGVRYIHQILVDPAQRTVTFACQSAPSGSSLTMSWGELTP